MTPRLRLFAGPNGSGKTTLTQLLPQEAKIKLGQYINPDEMALSLAAEIPDDLQRFREAQARAKVVREWCVEHGLSLTYESVMSHSSHLDFIRDAKAKGFRTYLYYVGVCDPKICAARVRMRHATGGHDVPEEKIVARYHRSMAQLPEVCRLVDRAYLFDNSAVGHVLVAEVDAGVLKIRPQAMESVGGAEWFVKGVLEKWDARAVRRVG